MTFAEAGPEADASRFATDRPTLRDVLRAATASDHIRLDQALADLRLAEPGDLVRFLGIHLAARAGIESWLAENAPVGWAPPVQTSLIAADLIELGGLPSAFPAPRFQPGGAVDWIGAAYVIAGSHLGNRLLLAQAGPALPCGARRFLTGHAMQDYWRRLRTLLNGAPGPDGGTAAARDAQAAFTHFLQCVDLFRLARCAAA